MKPLFLGRYSPKDPLELKAHELWEVYESECQKFDDTTCTGSVIQGAKLPKNITEQMAVTNHAREQRARVRTEAARLGIGEDVLEQVRRRYR